MKNFKRELKEFGEACIESFKEDWKFYVILISITLICFIPVDYYIIVGGGQYRITKEALEQWMREHEKKEIYI